MASLRAPTSFLACRNIFLTHQHYLTYREFDAFIQRPQRRLDEIRRRFPYNGAAMKWMLANT